MDDVGGQGRVDVSPQARRVGQLRVFAGDAAVVRGAALDQGPRGERTERALADELLQEALERALGEDCRPHAAPIAMSVAMSPLRANGSRPSPGRAPRR